MNTTPFSLRIFVADGDPDGLRIVDKSNWIGKAPVFARALLPQVKARPELAQTGLYLRTQDHSFSSPSTVAVVVLARSANGRVGRNAADGRRLLCSLLGVLGRNL